MRKRVEPTLEEKRRRLTAFFGKEGATIVLDHVGELDSAFGSASAVIELIMRGKMVPEKAQLNLNPDQSEKPGGGLTAIGKEKLR